jgi:hypothetical protein
MMRYAILALALALTGCGSGSEAPTAEPIKTKGTNVWEFPNDPTCANAKLATAGYYRAYPDRVTSAAPAVETWWYLTMDYARVFDWRYGVCLLSDFHQAHPRY